MAPNTGSPTATEESTFAPLLFGGSNPSATDVQQNIIAGDFWDFDWGFGPGTISPNHPANVEVTEDGSFFKICTESETPVRLNHRGWDSAKFYKLTISADNELKGWATGIGITPVYRNPSVPVLRSDDTISMGEGFDPIETQDITALTVELEGFAGLDWQFKIAGCFKYKIEEIAAISEPVVIPSPTTEPTEAITYKLTSAAVTNQAIIDSGDYVGASPIQEEINYWDAISQSPTANADQKALAESIRNIYSNLVAWESGSLPSEAVPPGGSTTAFLGIMAQWMSYVNTVTSGTHQDLVPWATENGLI